MLPEFYNQLGAMHGTIMMFLGVVPLAVSAFGTLLRPAPDRRARHGVPRGSTLPRFHHHHVQLRAPGAHLVPAAVLRPAQFITAFQLLLAFPALQAAAMLQGVDRLAGTSSFLPSGAFLQMFGIGGLTGLPLGPATTDIPLHDTNYVVGHFHYPGGARHDLRPVCASTTGSRG